MRNSGVLEKWETMSSMTNAEPGGHIMRQRSARRKPRGPQILRGVESSPFARYARATPWTASGAKICT
eukprot:12435756-Alexandrium_andersonii.AAC.1